MPSYTLDLTRHSDGTIWLKFTDDLGENTCAYQLHFNGNVTDTNHQLVNLACELQMLYEILCAEDSAGD